MLTRFHILVFGLILSFASVPAAWSLGAVHELQQAAESNCMGANCPPQPAANQNQNQSIFDFTPTPVELLIFGAALIALSVLVKKLSAAKENAPLGGVGHQTKS